MIQATQLLVPIKGLYYKPAGPLIEDTAMTDCRNVYFDKKMFLRKRDGYFKKGQNLPLSGPIMLLDQYYKTDGTENLIAITTKDAYYYDVALSKWQFITQTYITGTVSVVNGSKVVSGSGTSWLNNVKAGDYFGVGSIDANEITKWYIIETVDSDTQITLASNYEEESNSGLSYCIRKIYSGDEDNLFFAEIMNDIFIFTNYVNKIQKWDATTSTVQDLGGNPPQAKFVKKYKDYLILGNVFSDTAYPMRVQWSDTGDPETWNDGNAGYVDLTEGVDYITGLEILKDRIVVLKERSLYTGYPVSTSQIFKFDIVVWGIGCPAPASVISLGDEIFFLGWDNVYAFNGITLEPIGDPIKDELLSIINTSKFSNAHALLIEELNEYHLFIPSSNSDYPDTEFVFNYFHKAWTRNTRRDITRAGYYNKESSYTWDTMPGTWDSQTASWDDRFFQSLAPINLLGDKDGNVYEWDYTFLDDDDYAVDGWFTTKDFTMNDFTRNKYWCRLDIFGEGNSVDVYYSIDEGLTWHFIGKVDLTSTLDWHKLDFRVSSQKIRFKFQNNRTGETFAIRQFTLYWDTVGRI